MSTAVVVQNTPKPPLAAGGNVRAIVPQDFEQAYRFANMIAASGMAPKGMDKPEALMAAILQGMEVGMTPMMAVQSIAVVNGRATVWGDGAIGLVRGSGLCEYVHEVVEGEGDAMLARCVAKRIGEAKSVTHTFSVEDAKRAGLWQTQAKVRKKNWKTGEFYEGDNDSPWWRYPKRMLQMRARGFALRDAFADVLRGLAIREEVEDYPQDTVPPVPPTPPTPPAVALAKPEESKADPKVIDAEVVEARPDAAAEAERESLKSARGDFMDEVAAAGDHDTLSDILASWGEAMARLPQADRVAMQNAYEDRVAAIDKEAEAAKSGTSEATGMEPVIWGVAREKAKLGTKKFRLWFGSITADQVKELEGAPDDFADLASQADAAGGQ